MNFGQRRLQPTSPDRTALHSMVRFLICVAVFLCTIAPSYAFRTSPLRLGRANTAILRPQTFRSQFSQMSGEKTDAGSRLVRDSVDNLIYPTGADKNEGDMQSMASVSRAGDRRISKVMATVSKKSKRQSVDSILLADDVPREYDAVKDSVLLSPYEVNRNRDMQAEVDHRDVSNGFWNQDFLLMRLGGSLPPSVGEPFLEFPRSVHSGDSTEMMENQQLEMSSSSDHQVVTDQPTAMRRQLSSSTGAGGGRPVFNPTGW